MIPYYVALMGYIPVAMLLMLDKNSARGFSLAYLIGLMFLPSAAEIELPGVPDLSKVNVPAIGILLGTVFFKPQVFDRFRLTSFDFVFLILLQLAFLSAFLNDNPLRYGVSQSFSVLLNFALPVILARVHLGTPKALKTFFICLVLLSAIYAPLALWEFRMSPQIHTTVYGYFQHVFQQHARGSFWRPIVFFYHALALARFFAVATFLALFVVRKDLIKMFGKPGGFVFLAPMAGLVLSQSISPIMFFVLMSSMYLVVQRIWWAVYVVPAAAFAWLAIVFSGWELGYEFVAGLSPVSEARAQSFEYRLMAIREYKSIILTKPWFGWSGYGAGRIEGRATDSQMIIELLMSGLWGAVFYFGWFYWSMHKAVTTGRLAPGTPLGKAALGIACYASIAMTIAVVDAAVEHFLIISLAGVYGCYTWLKAQPPVDEIQERMRRRVDDGHAPPGRPAGAH